MNARAGLAVFVLCQAASAGAYETATHAELTTAGANASVNTLRALPELELSPNVRLLGDRKGGSAELTIGDWLRAGAVDEDDSLSATFARYRNHFYDPIPGAPNNGGFTGFLAPLGLLSGLPAPDWSLEPTAIAGQDHSHRDARTYLLNALVLPSKEERQRNFAKVFYTLGHVVHVIQDLAQPQHTRNDSHASGSLFEEFTNNAVLGREPGYVPPLSGAPAPMFPSVREFWVDQARFSNRNFVSSGPGKNFRFSMGTWLPAEHYQNPKPFGVTEEVPIEQLPGIDPTIVSWCGANCLMRFISSKAEDSDPVVPRAATYSIFTADLSIATAGAWQVSQNRFNFVGVHSHVLPRAVGYTAGVLDYFFRGQLDFLPHPADPGKYVIKNLGAEALRGQFRLYYDDESDTRREVRDAAGLPVIWDTATIVDGGMLAPGATMAVDGFLPPNPAPKVPGEYMLVFTGDMGEEKADSANGVLGAVVGKAVRAYHGALYFAGLDALNQVQHFKVDRNGVSAVGPNEVNPLAPPFLPATSPVGLKQALISRNADGTLVHRTVAVVIMRPTSPGSEQSLVEDLTTGQLTWKPGIRWTARSSDPAIGVFEFRLFIENELGTQASMSYVRRFTVNGQTSQASGSFLMPDLAAASANFRYRDIRNGLMFVNGHGTMLYTRSTGVPRFSIQFNLGAAPSATLVPDPRGTTTATVSVPPVNTFGDTGVTCTLNYIGSVGGSPLTATSTFTRRVAISGSDQTIDTLSYAGISADPESPTLDSLVEVRLKTTTHIFFSSTAESCAVAAIDYSGGLPGRTKMHVEFRKQTQSESDRDVVSSVKRGSLLFQTRGGDTRPANVQWGCAAGEAPSIAGPSALASPDYTSVDYNYEGFCPGPIQPTTELIASTLDSPQNINLPKKQIVRALTHDIEDAIYSEIVFNPSQVTLLKFRNTVLPPNQFVVETSPLAEVFIATPDFSLVEHHPKFGLPALQPGMLPAGITRIVNLVWM